MRIGKTIFWFFILGLVAFYFTNTFTLAQEGTVAGQKEKIEDLKERVATRVAQLRSQGLKVLVGEIQSSDKDKLTLKNSQGEKRILITEEAIIFRISRGKRSTLSVSNLKIGERVAIIGSSDSTGDFVAKLILAKTLPLNINGVIEKIDKENFTITVKSNQKGATYLVDIETTTKIRVWEKGKDSTKLGFSKLRIGDLVHAHTLDLSEEANRLSAVRLLVLLTTTPTPTP